MGVYTTELRNVIRVAETQAHGSYAEFEYTGATWTALGLDSYPIYDESHRAELNRKICDHFYMREIGAETVALFRLFVRRTMQEIMPYYNELYRTADLITNPLNEIEVIKTEGWGESGSTTDATTTDTTVKDTTSATDGTTSETQTDSNSKSIYNDTPMSMVQDDGGTLIEDGQYATSVTIDTSSTNESTSTDTTRNSTTDTTRQDRTDSNGTSERSGSRDETETGHRKSPAELVMEYRRAILNVDNMVIHDSELNDCFMNVY